MKSLRISVREQSRTDQQPEPNWNNFNGSNAAERISSEVFSDSFNTCLDITLSNLEDIWKTYSGLTINQGQIRLRPGTKVNIEALVQWDRDRIRLNEDPTATPFSVGDRIGQIKMYNTH